MTDSDSETFATVIFTPEGLREKFVRAYTHAQMMLRNGESVELKVGPAQKPIGVKQRGLLHAALTQVAEQVAIPEVDANGERTGKSVRYSMLTWKDFFRDKFLPPKWEMRRALVWDKALGAYRPARRPTPHKVHVSTETLGVRAYSDFIDQVLAYATQELGVVFDLDPVDREAARWKGKPA